MPGPHSLPPPTKKRKTKKDLDFTNAVQELEKQLTEAVSANSSLNKLVDLLDLVQSAQDPQDTSKAIYALYRVFVVVITHGKLGLNGDEDAKVVQAWIWERLHGYVDFLAGLLKDEEKFLRVSALQVLFSLLKHLSTSSSKTTTSNSSPRPQLHIAHFKKIATSLLLCPPSKRSTIAGGTEGDGDKKLDTDVRDLFVETWFSVYDDVRWFFLRESGSILLNHPSAIHPHLAENMLSILERLYTFPTDVSELNAWWVEELGTKPPKPKTWKRSDEADDVHSAVEDISDAEDDWRKFFDDDNAAAQQKTASARLHRLTIHQSLHSLPSHRAVFTRAWLALLPHLSIDVDSSKTLSIRALNVMHRGVIPHLTRPILVMDWVGTCVDLGGTVGLLALNALFVLMKEYNLDYPSFYTRLYAFVTRDVLHLKHRARFFRMTELFLSSTHLPATLLASFIKRLSRLSLNAPPSAIIMVIPFTYNILKRHPALMAMIHRTQDGDCPEIDQFVASEPNPNLTGALESSLWELHSHKNHYHSGVSTLARIFEEAFTKPGYSMEDFLDHTYGTLVDTESGRKIKKEPAMAMDLKSNILSVGLDEMTTGDLVNDLWVFG